MGRARHSRQLPIGVTIRRNAGQDSLQVAFSYRGVECRETLRLPPTPQNIRYAERLRAEILAQIERGTFDYAVYFPRSRRARLFGHGAAGNPPLSRLLDAWLADMERQVQPSTWSGYQKIIHAHLTPAFGALGVRDLAPAAIRAWLQDLGVSAKRARNILTPLRAVLDQALNDELLDRNPLDRVAVTKVLRDTTRKSSREEVDPFDAAERAAILEAARPGHERNVWQFALWTGLRTSELIALDWGDVDLVHGVARVQRAHVEGRDKAPKTKAGVRDVLLLPAARDALQAQKALTLLVEGGRVFRHPITSQPWTGDQQIRKASWVPLLKRAGVRYRNPYQTRHTYASVLLAGGESELWVARQLGHRTVEMVRRHYGRWIADPDQAGGYKVRGDYGPKSHDSRTQSSEASKGGA